jgi:hypothetical protein
MKKIEETLAIAATPILLRNRVQVRFLGNRVISESRSTPGDDGAGEISVRVWMAIWHRSARRNVKISIHVFARHPFKFLAFLFIIVLHFVRLWK